VGELVEGVLQLLGTKDFDVGVEAAERGGETRPGPGALDELQRSGLISSTVPSRV
jgi:hypothetical protein